ncbi:MAG: hypothetical protein ACE5KT_06615 [Methanosarcinales archaeon]
MSSLNEEIKYIQMIMDLALEEFITRYKIKKALDEMRKNVDWKYIGDLPIKLQKGLFALLETGNLHIAADKAGVPLDVINMLRKKANIQLVVTK